MLHWKRLRRAGGSAICLEDAYLNEAMLPGFLAEGLPTSLYDALEGRRLRPTWAEDAVQADIASSEEAELLGLDAGRPVLRLARRALCGERVVQVSRSTYRSDRFTLHVQLGDDTPELLAELLDLRPSRCAPPTPPTAPAPASVPNSDGPASRSPQHGRPPGPEAASARVRVRGPHVAREVAPSEPARPPGSPGRPRSAPRR